MRNGKSSLSMRCKQGLGQTGEKAQKLLTFFVPLLPLRVTRASRSPQLCFLLFAWIIIKIRPLRRAINSQTHNLTLRLYNIHIHNILWHKQKYEGVINIDKAVSSILKLKRERMVPYSMSHFAEKVAVIYRDEYLMFNVSFVWIIILNTTDVISIILEALLGF